MNIYCHSILKAAKKILYRLIYYSFYFFMYYLFIYLLIYFRKHKATASKNLILQKKFNFL